MSIEEKQAIRREALIEWHMQYTLWLQSIEYYDNPIIDNSEVASS